MCDVTKFITFALAVLRTKKFELVTLSYSRRRESGLCVSAAG